MFAICIEEYYFMGYIYTYAHTHIQMEVLRADVGQEAKMYLF